MFFLWKSLSAYEYKAIKLQVLDIEEMAWAPRYGLKGMVDASVRVTIESNRNETNEKIVPLEFKTGKAPNGQASICSLWNQLVRIYITFSFSNKKFQTYEWCLWNCALLTCCSYYLLWLFVQSSMEHSAQVILYTLLMSERSLQLNLSPCFFSFKGFVLED